MNYEYNIGDFVYFIFYMQKDVKQHVYNYIAFFWEVDKMVHLFLILKKMQPEIKSEKLLNEKFQSMISRYFLEINFR